MEQLPNELVVEIVKHLEHDDLMAFANTCFRFTSLVASMNVKLNSTQTLPSNIFVQDNTYLLCRNLTSPFINEYRDYVTQVMMDTGFGRQFTRHLISNVFIPDTQHLRFELPPFDLNGEFELVCEDLLDVKTIMLCVEGHNVSRITGGRIQNKKFSICPSNATLPIKNHKAHLSLEMNKRSEAAVYLWVNCLTSLELDIFREGKAYMVQGNSVIRSILYSDEQYEQEVTWDHPTIWLPTGRLPFYGNKVHITVSDGIMRDVSLHVNKHCVWRAIGINSPSVIIKLERMVPWYYEDECRCELHLSDRKHATCNVKFLFETVNLVNTNGVTFGLSISK